MSPFLGCHREGCDHPKSILYMYMVVYLLRLGSPKLITAKNNVHYMGTSTCNKVTVDGGQFVPRSECL